MIKIIAVIVLSATIFLGFNYKEKHKNENKIFSLTKIPITSAIGERGEMLIFRIKDSAKQQIIHEPNKPLAMREWFSPNTLTVNAGFFNEKNEPTGLLIINNKRIGTTIYDSNRSGVLILDETGAEIRNLATTNLGVVNKMKNVLQSYPILVNDGSAAVETDSGKKARRTAIGTDQTNQLYVIIVDRPDITLYEFAQLLSKKPAGISFRTVLNLDGGASTSVATDSLIIDSFSPIPIVLRFTP